MQRSFDFPDPNQQSWDFQAEQGEIPPYKLQLIRDVGAMADKLVERGRMTEIAADDVVICMRTHIFGNRYVPDDDDPMAA